MSEMIDRVARVLHEAIGYERWPNPECTQCLDAARKIIEAMREPTEAMWEAAKTAEQEYDNYEALPYSYAWYIMITAAAGVPIPLDEAINIDTDRWLEALEALKAQSAESGS